MLIQKPEILCHQILREPLDRIKYIASHPEEFYDEFRKYKKNKQGEKRKNKPRYVVLFGEYWVRIINPPKEELKRIQKNINRYLVQHIPMPSYAFGGIKNRDNILNARIHKGQKYIFQTDLKDFFLFITNHMVYEMFTKNGFSPDVASLLTKLTTFSGHIPQGAPTSTTIANFVFAPEGRKIKEIADREGLRFTTFVDDITISGQHDFKSIVPDIMAIITSRFKINQNKTSYRSGITEITGVKMLNNSLTITDKLKESMAKETDNDSLRAKGMRNYANRIKAISSQH